MVVTVLSYAIFAGIRLVSNFETLISLDANVASWVGSLDSNKP